MKVKLDENVPADLVAVLERRGHDALTVPAQGLGGHSDDAVLQAAGREERLLITLDLDFADTRRYLPGTHSGILVLRPSRRGRGMIRAVLEAVLVQGILDSLEGCTAVADEHRVRVRRRRPGTDPARR